MRFYLYTELGNTLGNMARSLLRIFGRSERPLQEAADTEKQSGRLFFRKADERSELARRGRE
jgi:hypothetical protein